METIYVECDDNTYIYGDNEFKAFVDENGKIIEPYYLKDNDKIVKYYPSKNAFIIYKDDKVIELVYTSTCWSDDEIRYIFENNFLVKLIETYHGFRKVEIDYENDVIIKINYNTSRHFGNYKLGNKAPNFSKFFEEYNLSIDKSIINLL